ncbi:hypothetical protein [Bacillus sp. OTU2372]|uniref:hypothetical protein n=1 Tax=Bacillus sp. OTU2372 TaxID=3043858 RepID=UPI00313EB66E
MKKTELYGDLSKQAFIEILRSIYLKGNESDDIKVIELIEEIKQQILIFRK